MVFASPPPEGRSLVDHLRQHPPANHRLVMWGCDPDLRALGWSRVQAQFTKPSTAPPLIEDVWLGTWTPEESFRDDVEQANAMIGSMAHLDAPWGSSRARSLPQYVIVEAQQVYAKRDERPGTVVAKANDLLRLAQISGAFQSRFADPSYGRAKSYLPFRWKGNAKKQALHDRAIKALVDQRCPVRVWDGCSMVSTIKIEEVLAHLTKAKALDALDAVCLALFGIDEIMCGRWVV